MWSPMASDFEAYADSYGYMWGAGVGASSVRAHTLLTLGDRAVVIQRPEPNYWHTELAQWNQTVGSWEERKCQEGSDILYTVLVCGETTGELESKFTHQESPAFLWGAYVTCPAQGFDTVANPMFLSISWGLEAEGPPAVYRYSLTVWADGKCELYEKDYLGAIISLGSVQLSWKWPSKGATKGEFLEMIVIPLAGGIAFRLIDAEQWHYISGRQVEGGGVYVSKYPYAHDLSVGAGGDFHFAYQGSSCHFEFGGVTGPVSAAGGTDTVTTLTSQLIGTDRVRGVNPTVQSRLSIPTLADPEVAADLVVTAIDHTTTDEIELEAEFTWGYTAAQEGGDVAEQADVPLSYRFAHFPELYALGCYFAPTTQAKASPFVGVELLSDHLNAVDVDLPDECDMASLRLSGKWRIPTDGAYGDWLYMRRVDLSLGYTWDDASVTYALVFTGIVATCSAEQVSPLLLAIDATATDVTVRLRNHECEESWPVMDGWDAETAANHICAKMGYDTAAWCDFSACSGILLSEGRPEQPLWRASGGSSPWDFLERICRYCLCEVAVSEAGVMSARAIMTIGVTTTTFAAAAYRSRPKVSRRHAFGYTGVMVSGRTVSGAPMCRWYADTRAESDPTYAFFMGYRKLERLEDAGLDDQDRIDDLAWLLYETKAQRQGDLVTGKIDGNTTLKRRDCAVFGGLAAGLVWVDRLCILGVHHHWGPSMPDTWTEIDCVGYPT